jgi:uncharacterized protein YaaQ
MKMIVAIVENNKVEQISQALLDKNYRITRLASIGGLFREGATTLMVGVDNELVENVLQIFRDQLQPLNPEQIQATLYVLNVKSFDRV